MSSSFGPAAEGPAVLRLAVVIYFAVYLQPRSLFLRRKVFHDFHQVADHFLTNAAHEGRPFWRNTNHHFTPVIAGNGPNDHSKILQPSDESARCRGSMSHLLGNCGHGQDFFLVEISQEKKLGKGNIAGSEFLAEMQNEAALHFQNDVGKLLGVGTELIGRAFGERCFRVQSALN